MNKDHIWEGTIRKLWPMEADKFRDHLLSLDAPSRRMRFAHAVSDSFIIDYASRMSANGAIVYAYVENDKVGAVAELRKIGDTWGQQAEAAFSVGPEFRDKGIATELMGRVIRSARNRGVNSLIMSCLADNAKMQAVARHHNAALHFEQGEVIGEIAPHGANALSMFAEVFEDRMGYLLAIFELKKQPAEPQSVPSKAA